MNVRTMRIYIAIGLWGSLMSGFPLLAEEANPDSAWLSLKIDGSPVLTELEVERGDTVVLHFMMKNAREVAHAFMVPLYYGDDKLKFLEAGMDTSSFPGAEKGAWQLTTKAVMQNDSAKVMLYAFTVSYDSGVPRGRHRLGWIKFEAVGKNEKSTGVYMGIDCFTLKKVR